MKYVLVGFALLLMGAVGLLNPVRDKVTLFFTPIQFGLSKSADAVKDFGRFALRMPAVVSENKRLIQENLQLESQVLELKSARDENALLRNQLGVKNPGFFDKEYVLAGTMGDSADASGATVVIDKGSRHGVRVGNNVIKGGHLVGIVRRVTREKSQVELIVSANVIATVVDLDSSTNMEGISVGRYGSYVEVQKILPSDAVAVGDTLVTSGKDGIFVPGLLVGKISRISDATTGPLRIAYLQSALDFSSLDKVFVLVDE